MAFDGHFKSALPATWAASTLYSAITYLGYLAVIQPSPANGYVYGALSGGTSGAAPPVWPTTLGATVVDGGVTWQCISITLLWELNIWDLVQSQTVNGDTGGTWAPQTPLQLSSANGGVVEVTGPTLVSNSGSLETTSGALVKLAAGDFPRNPPGHAGRSRRLMVPCERGLSDQALGMRQDLSLSALRAVACVLQFYVVPVGTDATVTVQTAPVRWELALDVHQGATLGQATLTYLSGLGVPTARVVSVSASGVVTPLTSLSLGADANGYLTGPPGGGDSIDAVTFTIPIDGGASASNAIVSRPSSAYLLQIVEDQTQTTFPGVLPVLSAVTVATTSAIDMANAPATIDGVQMLPGQRVLIKNQTDPRQNGVYVYPTLPLWQPSTFFAVGALAVSQPPNGYYYVATSGGTSFTGPPSWPTTVGSTVTESGGPTWTCFGHGTGTPFAFTMAKPPIAWLPNTIYAVGTLAQPSPPNGLYYECTGAGTSGVTQPAWPFASADTIADGGAVWTCQGSLLPSVYTPAIEMRTFGLLDGAVVPVSSGNANQNTLWQYGGTAIDVPSLGATPALPWGSIPTGFESGTVDVPQDALGTFSAPGNAYLAAAADCQDILQQSFQ